MSLAPITLFVYNRPLHTRRTVEALKKSMLAKHSELFVFSDGPKNEEDKENVEKVRNYIRMISGFKKITIQERKKNYGLAESILTGVTEIVNKYGKIIVLEDDLIVSEGFLKFMNDALSQFKNSSKVGAISGYVFPLKRYPAKPFFLRGGNCWGWGTWKRAWSLLEKNPSVILSHITKNNLQDEFDYRGYAGYIDSLRKLEKGDVKTWAILWYGTQFINSLFGYHPNYSLVQNIGFDGTGLHSGITSIYRTQTIPFVKVVDVPVREDELVRRQLTFFFRTKLASRLSITKRIFAGVQRYVQTT